ncbi:MAG: type 4a pilus biogenesis protein PilO [Chromatiales bacterium]|nr:type 4a pilus biogenesis protein PilO [Gammaproteobacteria bacterium]MBW6475873.1 type 4a pilus biogenesis protein PilO [Chromatiales bacterium]
MVKIDFEKIQGQFQNLDPDNIGNWPILVRSLIILLVCAAVLGAGYYFDTQHQMVALERVQAQESRLKRDFEQKQAKAANLEAYKIQMAEMEESFGTMLRQLPGRTEVEDLLDDITQKGLASGLEFVLFRPANETRRDFYAELPIAIDVRGDYHQMGQFVAGVAALPRIVTLHNIAISSREEKLTMTATARTYRYLDEDEIAAASAAQRRATAPRRR